MSDQPDPRHVARAIALQQLFTKLIATATPFADEDLLEILETSAYDQPLAEKIVAGVPENLEQIDPVIEELAPAWPIKQIAPVDLIILRMGIWEGFVSLMTPERVVINEAIELAKEFGGPNSSGFINGVLGALLNREDIRVKLNPEALTRPVEEKKEKPEEKTLETTENETDTPGIPKAA